MHELTTHKYYTISIMQDSILNTSTDLFLRRKKTAGSRQNVHIWFSWTVDKKYILGNEKKIILMTCWSESNTKW